MFDIAPETMWDDVDYRFRRLSSATPSLQPDEASVDAALGIIASCRRPVLVAGRGAAGARASLVKLAERIGAPVATTLGGKDLFRAEDFNLGIMGTLSHQVALETILEADCLLAFGAGLNGFTTASRSLTDGKAIIHCDIDSRRIGEHTRVDAGIAGDAATVADTLVRWLDDANIPAGSFRSPALQQRLREASATPAAQPSTAAGTIDVREALEAIDATVAAERTFVTDAGRFIGVAWTDIHVNDPTSFVFPANFGSIGLGLAAGIGATFAAGDRPVLVVCGDGGFMLGGLGEFSTAVREGSDLICVVCNDGAYGAELIQFQQRGLPDGLARFSWPDLAPVAIALGGSGVTVRGRADLDKMRAAITDRNRPLLIDLKLDPDTMPSVGH